MRNPFRHRRVRTRYVLAVAICSLLLAIAPVVSIDIPVAASSLTPPAAFVTVDGVTSPAIAGRVLKQGVRDDALGVCVGVDHTVTITVPPTIGYAAVDVGVDASCNLVVRSVTFDPSGRLPDGTPLAPTPATVRSLRLPAPIGAVAAADTSHQVWGRHSMREQFNVTTSLAHEEFTYTENGVSVANAVGVSEYCWVDGVGWTILDCYAGAEQNGPDWVIRYTKGDFTNQGGSLQHHLGAHPEASLYSNTVYCDGVGATMPFGWHDVCEFGRVN